MEKITPFIALLSENKKKFIRWNQWKVNSFWSNILKNNLTALN